MKKLLLFLALFTAMQTFAQEKIIKHTVKKGETITQIADKYSVSASDIYKLNPDSQSGLKPDMVLLIQSSKSSKDKAEAKTETKSEVKPVKPAAVVTTKTLNPEPKTLNQSKTHVVAAKETVYGLAKTYNISVSDLQKANPGIEKDGLKVGSTINIPASAKPEKQAVKAEAPSSKKEKSKPKEPVYHMVVSKETKYSIAKEYGISVDELEAQNPEIKSGLQIGFRLKIIPGDKAPETKVAVEEDKSVIVKPVVPKAEFTSYEVKPKETMYSLSKKTGLSQDELIKLNPDLKVGLKDGMMLKLPQNTVITEESAKETSPLNKSLNTQEKKQLVLLLPFNISKIEGDTLNSTTSRLKTDKFLNMTLDFYSGALKAIDSAKTLNLNLDIKILDSQETKGASAIASLIQQNNLQKADVIIGPFYQSNAEKAADLLGKYKVPVISPLSKDSGKSYSNLLQSMPSTELVKNGMMAYLQSKAANIVAVVDPKRISTKQFLTQNYKDVKLIGLNAGQLVSDSIVKKLVRGRKNYVIMDSEKTGMILNTLNILIAASTDYDIQLVILDKNDTLDFEEIPLAKLAQLHLLYPSLTRDNDTAEGDVFEKDYKETNKIFPNQFATRGFDVVFDAMMRLSQGKTFIETIEETATTGVESKFDYEKKASGGYVNKGFFVLYYDTDLSVKEAQ